MTNKLQEICTAKAEHVAQRKKQLSDSAIREAVTAQTAPRGFVENMRASIAAGRWALIAEVKKASPSKGLIRVDFNPAHHARDYQAGGASCLSVLTDVPYFQGHDDFLVQARAATILPCLRKDFMVDPWQVAESRALGADAILIIVAACDDALIRDLADASLEHGMDILIEVHDRNELDRALAMQIDARYSLIGINNRDLKRFVTDLAVTEELMQYVPDNRLIVTESGISGYDDCKRLNKAGIHAFLVGETLMRQDNLVAATKSLLNGPET